MQFTPRPFVHHRLRNVRAVHPLGSAMRIDNLCNPSGDVESKLDDLIVGSGVGHGDWADRAIRSMLARWET